MSNENPFNILNQDKPKSFGQAAQDENTNLDLNERIQKLIDSSDIFIFMKGTPDFPQCGFSANTVAIFNHLQKEYKTFDVLSDEMIRQGIKTFSNWPTIPQIYLKGKFVGGNDIVTEMFQSGDLQDMLN